MAETLRQQFQRQGNDEFLNLKEPNTTEVPNGYFGQLCPEYQRMPNFDKNRYLGRWYEGFRDSRIRFEKGECVTADYTDPGDSSG